MSITPPYPHLLKTLKNVRDVLPKGTKLTLAEKILYAHLRNPEESLGGPGKIRGERYLKLRPDRVAMQVGSHCSTKRRAEWSRTLPLKWLYSNS
jgi:homoaconitase